jgi:hypothetical protein
LSFVVPDEAHKTVSEASEVTVEETLVETEVTEKHFTIDLDSGDAFYAVETR